MKLCFVNILNVYWNVIIMKFDILELVLNLNYELVIFYVHINFEASSSCLFLFLFLSNSQISYCSSSSLFPKNISRRSAWPLEMIPVPRGR